MSNYVKAKVIFYLKKIPNKRPKKRVVTYYDLNKVKPFEVREKNLEENYENYEKLILKKVQFRN